MSTLKSSTRGFTLIELLVVITIIGILATGAVTAFTTQIQKARDSTRLSDINKISGAIETYNLDNAVFPNIGGTTFGTPTMSIFTGALSQYLPVMPIDAKTKQNCAAGVASSVGVCDYSYNVGKDINGIAANAYEISTAFENVGNLSNQGANGRDKGNCSSRLEIGTQNSIVKGNNKELISKCHGANTTAVNGLAGLYIR